MKEIKPHKAEQFDYYTRKQVEEMLESKKIIKAFDKWIYGQTGPLIEGKICYYKWDFERFLIVLGGGNVVWD